MQEAWIIMILVYAGAILNELTGRWPEGFELCIFIMHVYHARLHICSEVLLT